MPRKQRKQTSQQPSLSELIAQGWQAEYETLTWQRAEIVDSDAAAKSVQLRMIVRGLYVLVFTTIALIWGPWTVLYLWGASSSMRLWALPPPPIPSVQNIQTGLFVAGLSGFIYFLTRLSSRRQRSVRRANASLSSASETSAA